MHIQPLDWIVAAVVVALCFAPAFFFMKRSSTGTSEFFASGRGSVTTVCWLVVAFITPATDRGTLLAFYKKVRPFGPGWKSIRAESGLPLDESNDPGANIPLALLGWFTGCTAIWSALFTVGAFLYGRTEASLVLLGIFLVSSFVLIRVVKRLWE